MVVISELIILENVYAALSEADCGFMGMGFSFVALPTYNEAWPSLC